MAGGVLLLCSCCKRKLEYPNRTGYVEIALNWDSLAEPHSRAELRFYPQDGSAPLTFECGSDLFRGELPRGIYRVIVRNTDAEGVSYRGMASYTTAEVFAREHTKTKAGESVVVAQPRQVYGTGVCGSEEFMEIRYGDTLCMTASPLPLTRIVSFRFDITNIANIVSVSGHLDGVAAGVYLATGVKSYDYRCSTGFTASAIAGTGQTSYQTRIQVFGLSSQDEGEKGSNSAEVVITLSDGTVHQTQVDISDAIRQVIEQGGGEIPLDVPVRIELTLVGTRLTGSVSPWDHSGSGGGVVE